LPDLLKPIWSYSDSQVSRAVLCFACGLTHKPGVACATAAAAAAPDPRPSGVYVPGPVSGGPAAAGPSLDTPATSVEVSTAVEGGGAPEPDGEASACGSYRIMGCDGCLTAYAVRVRCHKRFRCTECMKALRNKILKLYGPFFASMTFPTMLTLTLKNCSDVKAAKKRLIAAFRRLRQRVYWRKNKDGSPRNLYGGWRVEVTTDADGLYHVHAHVLADIPWLDQGKLSEEWLACTGDSSIVDIRRIYGGEKGLLEVVKYIAKPWELTEDEVSALETGLKGERMFQFFGKRRPVVEPEPRKLICPDCKNSMTEWATCAVDPRTDPEFARRFPRVRWVKD